MTLTPEQKAENKRQRMIEKAKEYSTRTYINKFVAPIFHPMIRAEAGAKPSYYTSAIVGGKLRRVFRLVGQCVCVTCGKIEPWSGGYGGMNTGHFLASRRNSILFSEEGVACQCTRCNTYEGGAPQEYRQWMLEVRGKATVERLERLKETSVKFTNEELVDMRIEYADRLKAAIERMEGT